MISHSGKKFVLLMVLVLFSVIGCSTHRDLAQMESKSQIPPGLQDTENPYWWRCNFQITWPEETEINWGMDLLLAHAVVAPILVEQIDEIFYWRFHRRAARDATGHQFSFIFYCNPEVASQVFAEITKSTLLQEAYDAGLINKVLIDDPGDHQLPNVEDNSDRHWSLSLQRNWPSFIMGASSLWLGLIDDSMQNFPENHTDIHQLLQRYQQVDKKITQTWRTEGQHALLHHLNAIFGYHPLRIQKVFSF